MRWDMLDEEACSVARIVSVIGGRWTLLILRDGFLGVRRFEPFQERLGITLYPVLLALVHWGDLHGAEGRLRPVHYCHRSCGGLLDPVTVCSECREPLDARDVQVEPGPGLPPGRGLLDPALGRCS
jgi:DNA-binding HxlR family transcriptional regulator